MKIVGVGVVLFVFVVMFDCYGGILVLVLLLFVLFGVFLWIVM